MRNRRVVSDVEIQYAFSILDLARRRKADIACLVLSRCINVISTGNKLRRYAVFCDVLIGLPVKRQVCFNNVVINEQSHVLNADALAVSCGEFDASVFSDLEILDRRRSIVNLELDEADLLVAVGYRRRRNLVLIRSVRSVLFPTVLVL